VVLTTIGTALLTTAFVYRYSGARLSVIWLLEAQALVFAGIFTREIVFRRRHFARQSARAHIDCGSRRTPRIPPPHPT
jgi:hypothetical protein